MGPPWGAFCQITLTSCLHLWSVNSQLQPLGWNGSSLFCGPLINTISLISTTYANTQNPLCNFVVTYRSYQGTDQRYNVARSWVIKSTTRSVAWPLCDRCIFCNINFTVRHCYNLNLHMFPNFYHLRPFSAWQVPSVATRAIVCFYYLYCCKLFTIMITIIGLQGGPN